MKLSPIEVAYVNSCGDDLSVVNAARVSFHKESTWDDELVLGGEDSHGEWFDYKLKNEDFRLINYLAKHKHFSPFNHSFLTFRVKAPIFVARQLVKHKFMPWNEVSRRYVDEEPEFYMPEGWRLRAENVKQGSSDTVVQAPDWQHPIGDGMNNNPYTLVDDALTMYNKMLEADIAPEMARMVLPQNMMTEWWWSGTLGAFADMLRLRLDPHTQKESRDVANLILPYIQERFPVSIEALLKA